MSNLRGFIKNAFWTLFYQGISLGFNFLISVIIARLLGPVGKGIFSVYILIPSLLSMLLSLSLDEANVYFASKGYRIRDIFIISLTFTIIVSTVLLLTYTLLPDFFAIVFKNLKSQELFYAISITPFFLLFRYLRSIFLGIGHIKTYNFLDSMRIGMLFLLTSVLLIFINPDIKVAEKAINLHIMLAVIITFILIFPQLKGGNKKVSILHLLVEKLKYGIKAYLGITMSFFNRRLDVFILNYFKTPNEVGIYSISTALAELIWKLPNSIAIPLFPKVARENKEDSTIFTIFIARITFYILLICSFLMLIAGYPLIILLFGDKFSASFEPLILLLPGIVFIGEGRVLSAYFHGINKPEYGSFFTMASVIFTIVFDLLLIPPYGTKGAAIASSIAYTVSGILSIALFSKEAKINFFIMFTPPIKELVKILKRTKN